MKKRTPKAVVFALCIFLVAGCGQNPGSAGAQNRQPEQTKSSRTDGTENTVEDMPAGTGGINTETGAAGGQETGPVTFTDALGYTVTIDHPARTAVLSQSYADAWILAGGTPDAVTEDAMELAGVTEHVVNLGSVKAPGVETILAEEIDFVILSAAIEGHVSVRETLNAAGVTTAYFEVEHFEDYRDMMQIFTAITGREDLYRENVARVEAGIQEQIARAGSARELKSAEGAEGPSVLFLRAFSTGVRAKGSDSMTGRMLADLGCINIADSDDSLLEDLSMEAIIAADPDFIFMTTMGESDEAALAMAEELFLSDPAFKELSAVKAGRYYVLPKELFHNKPNSRWDESYRILADDIYGTE